MHAEERLEPAFWMAFAFSDHSFEQRLLRSEFFPYEWAEIGSLSKLKLETEPRSSVALRQNDGKYIEVNRTFVFWCGLPVTILFQGAVFERMNWATIYAKRLTARTFQRRSIFRCSFIQNWIKPESVTSYIIDPELSDIPLSDGNDLRCFGWVNSPGEMNQCERFLWKIFLVTKMLPTFK